MANSQEFYVIQCCECGMFQGKLVTKVPKFQCKICSTKQSVKKVVYQGSSADCRRQVQKLNFEKGTSQEQSSHQDSFCDYKENELATAYSDEESEPESASFLHSTEPKTDSQSSSTVSRWGKLLKSCQTNQGRSMANNLYEKLNTLQSSDEESYTTSRDKFSLSGLTKK